MRKAACFLTLLLGACASPAPEAPPQPAPPQPTLQPQPPSASARAAPAVPAANLEAYKREVAQRIASASPHVFEGPIQPMLKSIVVLDITIDRRGELQHVAVRRSNGFRELENRAIESVRRAAPFGAPPRNASVKYLETFLFRDDGRFRVRSLVDS